MRKRRKFDGIRFYREVASPRFDGDRGYVMIDGVWMRDRVKINGEEPDCPAVDVSEFERMLRKPGDYWPFTSPCGFPPDANIHVPVRCFHKDDMIIMVWRDPLQGGDYHDWPSQQFRYVAHRFRREDIIKGLAKLRLS